MEKLRKELEGKNKTESRFEVLPNIICIYIPTRMSFEFEVLHIAYI